CFLGPATPEISTLSLHDALPICFGAPFYAGWGLTDDRQPIPHRSRKRSLEDIFHFFYIWYTIYNVPGCPVPSQIEDALDFIESRSEEHTSELQSRENLVCRLLLE